MSQVYHIHAGAHRTGTSSFQMCLHVNLATLRAAGYSAGYPGRDGIPSGHLGLQLPSPRHGMGKQGQFAERVRRTLAEHTHPSRGHMILSEENIPGRMLHFFGGRFYPAAEARLDALMAALDGPVASLVFVVRDYAGLYQSAWRKRAEENLQPEFRSQTPALMQMDRGWPEVVALLQAYLKPERFLVVEYRSRGRSADLLWRLVPGVTGLVEPRRQLNVSVTEAALEALQERYAQGVDLSDAQRRDIVAAYAGDTVPRGLTVFSETEATHLSERYKADVQRLKAMPGIQFFG